MIWSDLLFVTLKPSSWIVQPLSNTIPGARIEEAGRRRTERIVFRQRPWPEIAISEPAEPSGFLADRGIDRADDRRGARDVVSWRIAD